MESTIEKLKDLINNFDPVSYLPDIASFMSWAGLFARICVMVAPIVMLLCGEESIREVITFPMNKNAQDLMMDAPTAVEKHQLDTVHIALLEE